MPSKDSSWTEKDFEILRVNLRKMIDEWKKENRK